LIEIDFDDKDSRCDKLVSYKLIMMLKNFFWMWFYMCISCLKMY